MFPRRLSPKLAWKKGRRRTDCWQSPAAELLFRRLAAIFLFRHFGQTGQLLELPLVIRTLTSARVGFSSSSAEFSSRPAAPQEGCPKTRPARVPAWGSLLWNYKSYRGTARHHLIQANASYHLVSSPVAEDIIAQAGNRLKPGVAAAGTLSSAGTVTAARLPPYAGAHPVEADASGASTTSDAGSGLSTA